VVAILSTMPVRHFNRTLPLAPAIVPKTVAKVMAILGLWPLENMRPCLNIAMIVTV